MANKPISQYPELAALTEEDFFVVIHDNGAYKFNIETLNAFINAEVENNA